MDLSNEGDLKSGRITPEIVSTKKETRVINTVKASRELIEMVLPPIV